MAEKKRKRGWAAKAEQFTEKSKGEYEYTGAYVAPAQGDEKSWKRWAFVRLVLALLAVAAQVVCGCIPAAGMEGKFYVLLPYCGSLIGACCLLWTSWRLVLWKAPLREYVYLSTVKKLPRRCLFALVFAGLSLVGELICLLIGKSVSAGIAASVLFLFLQAAVCALSAVLLRMEGKICWEKQPFPAKTTIS